MEYDVMEARYAGDYRIWLRFRDGTQGEIDLWPALDLPIYEPLKAPDYFARFAVEYDTLVWPNGADIAPEFLYDGVKSAQAAAK
jgi:hypothetical protein